MAARGSSGPFGARGATAVALVCALTLGGCGAAPEDARESGSGDGAYPVTVQTNQGEVTIEKAPERVVALGFAPADELFTLGVDPVAVAADPNALEETVPWLAEELAGVAEPGLVSTDGVPDLEAIAATEPDLIIAEVYQVKDKAAFDGLNAIAPTVTPDTDAVNPDWDERFRSTAAALGESARAKEVIGEIKAEFAEIGSEVPGIEDKTYQWVRADDNGYVFGNGSLFDLFGMVPADNQDNTQGSAPLALEKTAELDADLLAVWPVTEERGEALEDDALFQRLPSVRNGTVYTAGQDFANAINSPAPISLRWLQDELTPVVRDLAGA